MIIDLTPYVRSSTILRGQKLTLVFKNAITGKREKALELENVVAFIDQHPNHPAHTLDIRDKAGAYGHDMSLRLNRPEVQNFKEIFLFADASRVSITFRALAQETIWRDFEELVKPFA